MDDEISSILETLRELEKWKKRRELLEKELKEVERQISYYESVITDMKSKIAPEKLTDLFRDL
jgi:predicted  nucleic acid-binding Zn-ribbon protein